MAPALHRLLQGALAALLLCGCARPAPSADASAGPRRHHHHAPHDGTPVVLGDEDYHLELVLDPAAGLLQAYLLDSEMENFVRSAAPSIQIEARSGPTVRTLVLSAVPNTDTGETVGDTALFEGQAEWLKSARSFDGELRSLAVRGTTYSHVRFRFPEGNDPDL